MSSQQHPIDPALLPHHHPLHHHNQQAYASYVAANQHGSPTHGTSPPPPSSAAGGPNASATANNASGSSGSGANASSGAGSGGGGGGGGMYDLPPPASGADDPSVVDVVGLQSLSDAGYHLGSHSLQHHHHGHHALQQQQQQAEHDDGAGGSQADAADDGSLKDDGVADGRGSRKRKRAPNGQGVRTIARKQAEESASYINSAVGRATAFKNGIATIEHNMRLLETKTGAMIFYIAALPDEPPSSSASPQQYIAHTSPALLEQVPPNFYVTPSGEPLYPGSLDPQQPSEAVQQALAIMVDSIGGLQQRWRAHHPGEPERKKGRPPHSAQQQQQQQAGGSVLHHAGAGGSSVGGGLDPALGESGAGQANDGEQYLNHHHMAQHPQAAAAQQQHDLQQQLNQFTQQQGGGVPVGVGGQGSQPSYGQPGGGGGPSDAPSAGTGVGADDAAHHHHHHHQAALDEALLLGGSAHPIGFPSSLGVGSGPGGAGTGVGVGVGGGGGPGDLASQYAEIDRSRAVLDRTQAALDREKDDWARGRAGGAGPGSSGGGGVGGPGGADGTGVDDDDRLLGLHHDGGPGEAEDEFGLKMD